MKKEKFIEKIIVEIVKAGENAGRTLDADFLPIEYKKGYSYSADGQAFKIADENDAENIKRAAEYLATFKNGAGLWYAGGVLYIDFTFYTVSYKLALQYSLKNKQLSFYDWSTGDCHDTQKAEGFRKMGLEYIDRESDGERCASYYINEMKKLSKEDADSFKKSFLIYGIEYSTKKHKFYYI